jgi:hypothetical protein
MYKLEKLLNKAKETSGDDSMGTLGGETGWKKGQEVMERLKALVEVDVSFVRKVLDSLYNKVVGKGLDNKGIEKAFNIAFKPYKIIFKQGNQSADEPCKLVSAATIEDGVIEIIYARDFNGAFMNDGNWDNLIETLSQFLSHELVHRAQFADIKDDVGKKGYSREIGKQVAKDNDSAKKYLANDLEIEAFAREACQEYKNAGYSNKEILKRVKNPSSATIAPDSSESSIFINYQDQFGTNSKEMKKFLGYMEKYLK